MNSSGWLLLVLALIGIGVGGLVFFRAEGSQPAIEGPGEFVVGRAGATVPFRFTDAGSGLRSAVATLVHAGGEIPLLSEEYPGNLLSGGVRPAHAVEIPLEAARLGEVQGDSVLRVAVRDWSWRDNETVLEVPVTVDLNPPRIDVATGLTYADQGGSSVVVYRLSEPAARDGVRVGEFFFPGYPHPDGREGERVAIFAIPAGQPPETPVAVVAEDAAGNASEARWPLVVRGRPLPEANVTLSRELLERLVPKLSGGANGDVTAAFDRINTKIRAENEAQIRAALASGTDRPLFDGALSQQPNSKVTSRFGERRSYFMDGQLISRATHFGYDLASFAAAPILAAGAGRVAYSAELGIYGNCVLVDHGLGLTTLYGHLSRLDVRAGDEVAKGQRLGLSGATGLAGGDHLHFAVLVGKAYVDPLEWWDAKWVATHVAAKLGPSAPAAPARP